MLVNEEEEDMSQIRIEVGKQPFGQVDANLAVHVGLARARLRKGFANVVEKAEEECGLGADAINIAIVRANQATT
jgi:hypothetical protein